MSLTDRDRKIVLVIVPVVVILAYWFLALSPKREEAVKAGENLAAQEQARDGAESQLAQLRAAKTSFAADYAQLVRLGKAVPAKVDMPSLLVQLDSAARGTGIAFTKIAAGEPTLAAPVAQPPAEPGAAGGTGTTPAAPGGVPAQSAPGSTVETAGGAVNSANDTGAAAAASGVDPADTSTSAPASQGGLPVGGGAAAPAAPGTCAAGLECVPLTFEFDGKFFELADFFHRLKRFVRVSNEKVLVQGRLLSIDGLSFTAAEDGFPALKAEVEATVYLAPRAEGTAAGASPQGPGVVTPAATPVAPAESGATPVPTAVATP
jgi:hypothetical protein